MVQKHQIRKFHEDAHYASALFCYEKKMATKYKRCVTLVLFDDKNKVPVGDPGCHFCSLKFLNATNHLLFATGSNDVGQVWFFKWFQTLLIRFLSQGIPPFNVIVFNKYLCNCTSMF